MKPGWRIRRLDTGSRIVARRTYQALVPLDTDGEIRLIATILRTGPALAAAPGLLDLAHQSPVWLVGGTSAWCIAAWKAGAAPVAEVDAENTPAEETREHLSQEQATTLLLARIHTLIGANRGVHLDRILEELIADRQLPAVTTVADLRRDLTARGIPTRDSLKANGAVRVGIHADDLQPLSQPLPQTALADVG
jgi:hypothetical protein